MPKPAANSNIRRVIHESSSSGPKSCSLGPRPTRCHYRGPRSGRYDLLNRPRGHHDYIGQRDGRRRARGLMAPPLLVQKLEEGMGVEIW